MGFESLPFDGLLNCFLFTLVRFVCAVCEVVCSSFYGSDSECIFQPSLQDSRIHWTCLLYGVTIGTSASSFSFGVHIV